MDRKRLENLPCWRKNKESSQRWFYHISMNSRSSGSRVLRLAVMRLSAGITLPIQSPTRFLNSIFANFAWNTIERRRSWISIPKYVPARILRETKSIAMAIFSCTRWMARKKSFIVKICAWWRSFSSSTRRCTTTPTLSISMSFAKKMRRAVILYVLCDFPICLPNITYRSVTFRRIRILRRDTTLRAFAVFLLSSEQAMASSSFHFPTSCPSSRERWGLPRSRSVIWEELASAATGRT